MTTVVFFDLDGTLVAQEEAFEHAYRSAAELAAATIGLEARTVASRIPAVAERVLESAPFAACVRRCRFGGRDILWGEALSADGCEGEVAGGIETFRRRVWSELLELGGVRDAELCERLQGLFVESMTNEVKLYSEVEHMLRAIGRGRRLAVITNGLQAAQNAKLQRLGIDRHFDVVIASAVVGFGKPAARIFEHALGAMSVQPQGATMVGDALDGDIDGAKRAGIRTIWLNRAGGKLPQAAVEPDEEIRDLTALENVLASQLG